VPLTVALAAALAAVLAGAAPPTALDADAPAERAIRVEAALHLRWTSTRGLPSTDVLYDPAERTFAVDRYLGRGDADRYGSVLASLRFEGTHLHGDLRWVVAVDSGEVRRRQFPATQTVCLTAGGTGLANPGRFNCALTLGAVSLETTQLDGHTWTSNGRPLRDEARDTLLVREAYAAYSFGRAGFATVRAGRRRLTVGDGLVHDDYALGAEVDLDLGAIGPPFQAVAGVYDPSRDWPRPPSGLSPLGVARVDWLPSLFEHAGVFAAALHDRTGSVGELVRSGVVERRVAALAQALGTAAEAAEARNLALALSAPLESDASMAWYGTSGSLAPFAGQRLGWTLALMEGTLNSLTTSRPATGASVALASDVPLRGHAESVRWDSDLGRRATVGAFLLHLSGGQPLSGTNNDEYHPFLGVTPYVTATHLFFGGGLAETFASRHVTAPGVNGRGVLAPGLRASFDPVEKVGVRAKAAYLRADAAGPFGGRVYGTEADLEVTWSPFAWVTLGAELDVLWPGDFYRAGDRAPMTKAVLALDLLTP
jgi:hypothetical protein